MRFVWFYVFNTSFHPRLASFQDHIHEGNGFLLQHAKITNIFETSLKAIDPSVFLPYWDYTIDDSDKHSAVDSFVMTPKLYGRLNNIHLFLYFH